MSAKARSWLFAATGGILGCGLTVMLNWPGIALATPSKDFTSEFTRSFFERIRVLGGTDKEGEDARVKIIAKDPSDVYIASNTVAPGGYSGWHTHPGPSVVLVKSGTRRSMTATTQTARLSGMRQEPDSSTPAAGTSTWCAMKAPNRW